jgi:hypothetical protein
MIRVFGNSGFTVASAVFGSGEVNRSAPNGCEDEWERGRGSIGLASPGFDDSFLYKVMRVCFTSTELACV